MGTKIDGDDPFFGNVFSVREYMATHIMAGFAHLSHDDLPKHAIGDVNVEHLAEAAIQWADYLIDALNKPKDKETP